MSAGGRAKEEVWKKPKNVEVKLIDFGGASEVDEYHTAIINTRQYRAPEVILSKFVVNIMVVDCQQWDMKSDVWSMASILAELYTGEMFFSTHENVEHLALMEKICGPFPRWMADKSQSPFREYFNLSLPEEAIEAKGMRLDWPKVAKRRDSV